jgi:dethiobiotin synthetase
MSGFFVTGTDTGCGKTEITLGLMAALQRRGMRVLGMKPVASGCIHTASGLHNEDAMRLRAAGSAEMPYDWINPYAFEPPIAPHIAAAEAGIAIDLATIERAYARLARNADRVLVEGVGGWRVPLGPERSVGDIPVALDLPVILVVGLRLGCINHALLTADSIQWTGGRLVGWIGNQIDPDMAYREANLATLTERLTARCLGVIPWLQQPAPEIVGAHLHLKRIDRPDRSESSPAATDNETDRHRA